jgi:hypothetical protein
MSQQSPGAKFLASLLSGSVESIARAGAKALESLADDAEKALKKEASRIRDIKQGAQVWRHSRLGDDLPGEVHEKKEKTR